MAGTERHDACAYRGPSRQGVELIRTQTEIPVNSTHHTERNGRERHGAARMRSRAGFTLVEILLVLGIVAIILTIAAPALSPDRWRSDGAVQVVAIAMNAAQRTAVLRQHDVVLTFERSNDRIQVHVDLDNDGVVDSGESTRVIELPETIGFKNTGAAAISGGTPPITFASGSGDPVLTFHRNGSASSEGAVYLGPVRGRKTSVPTAARAVTIERATGVVRCFSYRTGSWEEAC